MKKASMLMGALAAMSLVTAAWAQAPQDTSQTPPAPPPPDNGRTLPSAPDKALDKQDREFVEEAAQGGLLEVKLGQIAIKQAASDEVRQFGQRMVDEHTKLNDQLIEIARKKGIMPAQQLDKKHQDHVDKIMQHHGVAFDREYMSRMVDDHQSDVKAFEKESKDGKDAELKQFASTALPMLREHLTLAKDIHGRLKK